VGEEIKSKDKDTSQDQTPRSLLSPLQQQVELSNISK